MPDAPPAPGYWMASDGNWYAPELHPDYVPPTPPPADDARYAEFLLSRDKTPTLAEEIPPSDFTASTLDSPSYDKRNRLRIAAVGVLVLILIAAATLYITQSSKSTTTTTASMVVQPCQSMVSLVEHPPATPPTNYLYAPASGATTPQAAINDVESTSGSRGLLAACPYITSQFVWDTAHLAHTLDKKLLGKAATQAAAAEEKLLLHGDGASPVVKITKLHCTSTQCTATVQTTVIAADGSGSSSGPYIATKYNGEWYVNGL